MEGVPRRPSDCCRPAPPRVRGRAGAAGLVRGLAALAEPTRLALVELLGRAGGAVCVCDLVARFDLGQPTISHHLGLLRTAGLVSVRRVGRWAYYQLRRRAVLRLQQRIGTLARTRPVRAEGACR